MKDLITDQSFMPLRKKSLAIIKPIHTLIMQYQSDSVPISEVLSDFYGMPTQFMALYDKAVIMQTEMQYPSELSSICFRFMYGEGHGLPYLLDSRMLGDGLPPDNQSELEYILVNWPFDDVTPVTEERMEEVFNESTHSLSLPVKRRNRNRFRFKILMKGVKTPLQYYQIDGERWPLLQGIALKLFQMLTSSAASEWTFSTMRFIHSKLRNSLFTASVEKLVFVKTNLALILR